MSDPGQQPSTPSPPSRSKRWWTFFFLKIAFIAALFVLLFRPQTFGFDEDLFHGITPGALWAILREVDTGTAVVWFGFAVLIKLAGISAGILRWRLLLREQNLRMPIWYLTKCWFMGRAIGLFLPGTMGLDGYRLVESSRQTREVIKCTTVIAIEKLTGFIALAILVCLTLPLGLRFLEFNVTLLAMLLLLMVGFIGTGLLVLFNPRVIALTIALIPFPPMIRKKATKLGVAVAAYSGRRGMLALAVGLGLCVHLGTCLMYFGTASAVRAVDTSILDILFISPLVIVGSIIGPTVSGLGVRELLFGYFLADKAGVAASVVFAHLGLWAGEVVPLTLSLPLLLSMKKPSKDELTMELRRANESLAETRTGVSLSRDELRVYRLRLFDCLLAGLTGGLLAGALIGGMESIWVARILGGLEEYAAFWWGPLVYGILFAGVGLGAACGLAFLYLVMDRFPRPSITFGLCLGGLVSGGMLVFGAFRYFRDVMMGHMPDAGALLVIALIAGGAGLVLGLAAHSILARFGSRFRMAGGAVGLFIIILLVGVLASWVIPRPSMVAEFAPSRDATGPPMILIVLDALRADYLSLYAKDAQAHTPRLDAFAEDAITFQRSFSNASWTKPAFGTLFTGLYPETHTATGKNSMLPDSLDTVAELLQDSGYYTKGIANNPNITRVFNFDQGFVEYVDLRPNLYFGASVSSSRLAIYEVLRRVRQQFDARVRGGRLNITDFYQPAEAVTDITLDWFDEGARPEDAPYFLFVHYMDPHDPFMNWDEPGEGYARVRMPDPDPDRYLEAMVHAYNRDLEYLDSHLGALFDGLKERGLYDEAMIIITADHGEEFYDHEGWWHGQTLYDELLFVPLLIKLPENASGGSINPYLARHLDLPPTILEFAGAPIPEIMPGVPLINGQGEGLNEDVQFVYAENDFEGNTLQAVRTTDAKLIHANSDNRRNLDTVEFFDLEMDPGEQENITGAGDIRESILDSILEGMEATIREHAPEPQIIEDLDPELLEQMRGVGYM